MRGTANGVALLVIVLLSVCGCVTTGNRIRPPKLPEQYNSPPANDPRYTNPPRYPKNTMKRKLQRQDNSLNNMRRRRGAPGMPGMGSGGAPMMGGPGMGMNGMGMMGGR